MSMDFNNAESNSGFDLIPANTVAPMILTIRPGSVGDGGWETTSDKSDYNWLNCELTITGGRYRGRKIWQNMMCGHPDPENKAVNITRSTLRGILESARKIKPDDTSETARTGRVVSGYGDFSGLEFVGKIGIEKGKDGYDDKNKLLAPVPVTSPQYACEENGAKSFGNVAAGVTNQAAKVSANTPSWAQ